MKSDPQTSSFCDYPPRLADSVDVTELQDAGGPRFVVRNRATARYFTLKPTEYAVFRQFDGSRTVAEVAAGLDGPRVAPLAVRRFLTKLDSLGLLARGGAVAADTKPGGGLYRRIRLFDPDRLLGWLDRRFGWALSRPAVVAVFALMGLALFGLLVRAGEVAAYSGYAFEVYGLAVVLAFTLAITAMHEMAHGWACKHFGGEVREVGVLMIFYVLPAFYCNVSDMYRFPRRAQRLWVIFAGIYWQLGLSAAATLVWLVSTPYTWLADLAFLTFLGGTFNVLFNCNPLIKLDGYYALSQWLGIANLQGRAAALVGGAVARLVNGGAQPAGPPERRRLLLVSYWFGSLVYSVALVWLILAWAGEWLMDRAGLAGVLLTVALALLLTERWWRPAASKAARAARRVLQGDSSMTAQVAKPQEELPAGGATRPARRLLTRARVVKAAVALLVIAALVAPWEASTGSDCTLLLPPGREAVARANTDAVLAEILVQPGDAVAQGEPVARLRNPEIEDRLTQLNAEIERLTAAASRIEDELRVRSELMLSANFKETEQKRLAGELKSEAQQITRGGEALPAALRVLQSEVELRQTEMEFNRREAARYKKLFEQGLVGEQQYDRAAAAARLSEKELLRARAALEAAIVAHRRQTSSTETGSLVAETEARAARSHFEALIAELQSNREQLDATRQRRDILQKEYDGMAVVAPRGGVVLGEDLRREIGRRYGRGEEIVRIGELERFLLRVDVSEREIVDVRLDSPVRFKLKTVPGRTFTGRVSKINAEPITDERGQRFYPVEVVVENADGILRPGMTGFARISFGRQAIGLILAEKLWHALRPELWLF